MWIRQIRYRYNRHPTKSWRWCKQRYWGKIPERRDLWVFMNPKTGQHLYKMSWIPTIRHVLIRHGHSPDDPTLREYWKKRQAKKVHYQYGIRAKLWQRQKGICVSCYGALDTKESVHMHHIKPKSQQGDNTLSNLCLLHRTCHRQLHSRYGPKYKLLSVA